MKFLISILTVTLLFCGTLAKAQSSGSSAGGIVFNPSFLYYTDNDNNQGGTKTSTSRDVINLKLGYLMTQGFYFGFNYDIDNKAIKNGSTTNYDRKSYGGTVGYVYNGWQFMGTYFLSSELDAGSTTYKGSGYALDIGYSFNIGSVGIGPVISYRSWTYNKKDGSSISPNESQSNIFPMLQIFMTF